MPTIPSTTLTIIEAGLRTRIDGITPTHETQQTSRWQYAEDRNMPAPSMVPRLYSFEWSNPGVVEGGATGNLDTEASITLSIVVDYRAFREEDLGWIVESDHWDLSDRIFDSWSQDLIPGLTFSSSQGFEAESAQRVIHSFELYYMRARRQ